MEDDSLNHRLYSVLKPKVKLNISASRLKNLIFTYGNILIVKLYFLKVAKSRLFKVNIYVLFFRLLRHSPFGKAGYYLFVTLKRVYGKAYRPFALIIRIIIFFFHSGLNSAVSDKIFYRVPLSYVYCT